jgi:hypothetical protein
MADNDMTIINLPPEMLVRKRTLKSGKVKARVTIEVESEPIIHHWTNRDIGKGPAEAIVKGLQKQMQRFGNVMQSTFERRQRQAAQGERGGMTRSYRRHFMGGRIGHMPPQGGNKLFINSGRLLKGLFARHNPRDGTWTVNVPANRLNPDPLMWPSTAAFQRMLDRWKGAVNYREITSSSEYQKELTNSVNEMLTKVAAINAMKRQQLRRAIFKLGTVGARAFRTAMF